MRKTSLLFCVISLLCASCTRYFIEYPQAFHKNELKHKIEKEYRAFDSGYVLHRSFIYSQDSIWIEQSGRKQLWSWMPFSDKIVLRQALFTYYRPLSYVYVNGRCWLLYEDRLQTYYLQNRRGTTVAQWITDEHLADAFVLYCKIPVSRRVWQKNQEQLQQFLLKKRPVRIVRNYTKLYFKRVRPEYLHFKD